MEKIARNLNIKNEDRDYVDVYILLIFSSLIANIFDIEDKNELEVLAKVIEGTEEIYHSLIQSMSREDFEDVLKVKERIDEQIITSRNDCGH